MAEQEGFKIPGLPEGVEAVALQTPKIGDYFATEHGFIGLKDKGCEVFLPCLIVRASRGYEFVEGMFGFEAVKKYDQPEILRAIFKFSNPKQHARAIEALKEIPGFSGAWSALG